jgi:uncharacterized protein (DUF58 family)
MYPTIKKLFTGPTAKEIEARQRVLSLTEHSAAKALELKMERAVSSELVGQYSSAFFGSGLSFSELREYQPGDDPRFIHWPVTARFGKPYIKLFKEERELKVIIAIDTSLSMSFSGRYDKAAQCAAMLLTIAKRNKDKAGLVLFADGVKKHIPISGSRGHFRQLLNTLTMECQFSKRTDYEHSLDSLRKLAPNRSAIFLLSDFENDFPKKSLSDLTIKNQLNIIAFSPDLEDLNHENLLPYGLSKITSYDIAASGAEESKDYYQSLSKNNLNKKKMEYKAKEKLLIESAAAININMAIYQGSPMRTIQTLSANRTAKRR